MISLLCFVKALHSSIREKEAVQLLEFADNYSGTHGTDLVIIAGDLNSNPGTPVYNLFSQLVDCLVVKFGAGSSSLASHHTWGQTSNTYTGPGGSQNDNHSARSVVCSLIDKVLLPSYQLHATTTTLTVV